MFGRERDICHVECLLENLEIIDANQIEVEHSHNLTFLANNLLLGQLLMGNFLMDELNLQRVYFLVLARYKDGSDAHQMQITGFVSLFGLHKERIHNPDSREERRLGILIRTDDLNDPIDHFGPQLLGDLMLSQYVGQLTGLFSILERI